MTIRAPFTPEDWNTDVVRRFLRVFETFDVDELASLVDPDVIVHEAGTTVHGLRWVTAAVRTPGLAACRIRIDDLFAARDRVMVACTVTYVREDSGQQLTLPGLRSYRLTGGRIVELWGATDVFGFLREAGLVPHQVHPAPTAGRHRVASGEPSGR